MSAGWLDEGPPAPEEPGHPVFHAVVAMIVFASVSGLVTALALMVLIRLALG